ncbi:MAG: bifunctional oligoribonuclease/PAP phosphatase NrnA [Actinobacteria bacterium]|nr:bifunctional oligoribonuclease/PAP phosphatase NrnA [Actinomycetota bacterium]
MKDSIRRAIRRAADALAAAPDLAVACHVSPDGDALGSTLGLARAAAAAGKRVVASFGSPFAVSEQFGFLDRAPLVPPEDFPASPALMVVLDAASPDRLGELAGPASRAGTLVVVDHHVTNPGFGHVAVVDPQAAATAELVYHLVRRLGWPVDRRTATALLAGIVSDTGRFQFSSTAPGVLRVAAALVAAGARPEDIGQRLYEWRPFGYLQVAAAVLGRARLDGGLVWSVLYAADAAAAGVGPEDLDLLIDDLRVAREAEVAALVKETPEGWKVSLRSRGRVDVGTLAAAHGGGGHHNAAGFNMRGNLAAVVDAVRAGIHG